eukprot:Platyproteum_vivax@DN6392_c0_g1_i5.p1
MSVNGRLVNLRKFVENLELPPVDIDKVVSHIISKETFLPECAVATRVSRVGANQTGVKKLAYEYTVNSNVAKSTAWEMLSAWFTQPMTNKLAESLGMVTASKPKRHVSEVSTAETVTGSGLLTDDNPPRMKRKRANDSLLKATAGGSVKEGTVFYTRTGNDKARH